VGGCGVGHSGLMRGGGGDSNWEAPQAGETDRGTKKVMEVLKQILPSDTRKPRGRATQKKKNTTTKNKSKKKKKTNKKPQPGGCTTFHQSEKNKGAENAARKGKRRTQDGREWKTGKNFGTVQAVKSGGQKESDSASRKSHAVKAKKRRDVRNQKPKIKNVRRTGDWRVKKSRGKQDLWVPRGDLCKATRRLRKETYDLVVRGKQDKNLLKKKNRPSAGINGAFGDRSKKPVSATNFSIGLTDGRCCLWGSVRRIGNGVHHFFP